MNLYKISTWAKSWKNILKIDIMHKIIPEFFNHFLPLIIPIVVIITEYKIQPTEINPEFRVYLKIISPASLCISIKPKTIAKYL